MSRFGISCRIGSLARALAVLISIGTLNACSVIDLELNNRGGYLDQKLDNHFMVADTKPMRVLRAYLMIGSITRLSREHYYRSEREIIVQHVNSAILVANDAFACAYARPGDCVYFDEKMAELEVALLRLATAVFSKQENENLFDALSKSLAETSPLFKGIDSFGKLIDAMHSTGELATQVGKVVLSLLKIGGAAYTTGRRIGALYRDAMELDMVAVLGSLQYQCHLVRGRLRDEVYRSDKSGDYSKFESVTTVAREFYGQTSLRADACAAYSEGQSLYSRGAGNLAEWKAFLGSTATKFRKTIIPGDMAFIQASDLIWRACEQISDSPALVSKCLGARPNIYECGCQRSDTEDKKANCPLLEDFRNTTPATQEKTKKANLAGSAAKDSCPLLVYNETWSARVRRFSGASARLDWLSLPRDSLVRLDDEVIRSDLKPSPAPPPAPTSPKAPDPQSGPKITGAHSLSPTEKALSVADGRRVQAALCVRQTGHFGDDAADHETRRAIVLFHQAVNRDAKPYLLDAAEAQRIAAAGPCAAPYRNAYERFKFAAPNDIIGLHTRLQTFFAGVSNPTADERIHADRAFGGRNVIDDATRKAIALARARTGLTQVDARNFEMTSDLYERLLAPR